MYELVTHFSYLASDSHVTLKWLPCLADPCVSRCFRDILQGGSSDCKNGASIAMKLLSRQCLNPVVELNSSKFDPGRLG